MRNVLTIVLALLVVSLYFGSVRAGRATHRLRRSSAVTIWSMPAIAWPVTPTPRAGFRRRPADRDAVRRPSIRPISRPIAKPASAPGRTRISTAPCMTACGRTARGSIRRFPIPILPR